MVALPLALGRPHSDLELSPAYFTLFVPGMKTYICQGEGIGAVAPALSSARGKLGFIFGTSYYRFGRAALQPRMQREFFDSSFAFSAPLRAMLEFLEYVASHTMPSSGFSPTLGGSRPCFLPFTCG